MASQAVAPNTPKFATDSMAGSAVRRGVMVGFIEGAGYVSDNYRGMCNGADVQLYCATLNVSTVLATEPESTTPS